MAASVLWHDSDRRPRPLSGRYHGENGLNADIAEVKRVTRLRHKPLAMLAFAFDEIVLSNSLEEKE